MANTPQLDAQWFAGICALGPRPLVVTGWLKLWLQGHFGSRDNIEDAPATGDNALSRSLWTPDFKTSKLVVESVTRWSPELTEQRPAIMIKRNGWQRLRLGFDDRMLGSLPADGYDRHANWWKGSHTLFCIAGEGAEAERLAAELCRELNQFGPAVRRILDLKKFEVLEVGELTKLPADARENFAVPVTITYVYEEGWKLERNAAPLGVFIPQITAAMF